MRLSLSCTLASTLVQAQALIQALTMTTEGVLTSTSLTASPSQIIARGRSTTCCAQLSAARLTQLSVLALPQAMSGALGKDCTLVRSMGRLLLGLDGLVKELALLLHKIAFCLVCA